MTFRFSYTNRSSVNDLRNATDDQLPFALETLGYQQSFTLIDTKLALGYLTVAIAGLLFYMDKKFAFKDTYYAVIACVAAYFVISTIMLYFTSGPQKDNKYIGFNDAQQKILVYSWTSKYDPIYNVKIVLNDNTDSAVEAALPFTKFFDGFGYYNQEAFVGLVKEAMQKKNE